MKLIGTALFGTFLLLLLMGCGALTGNNAIDGYAIVYGVSTYITSLSEDTSPNLPLPDDDAIAMADLLEEKGYTIISGGPRLNEDATKENLILDVAEAASLADEDSTVIFYFAGHGFQAEEFSDLFSSGAESSFTDVYDSFDEWLLLFDSVHIDGSTVSVTPEDAVYDDELNTILSVIDTPRKVVLIDACNSGGFIGESGIYDSIPQDVDGWLVMDGPFSSTVSLYFTSGYPGETSDIPPFQAFVFSASGEQEDAYESSLFGHGIFTYFLLESGENGDANGDGFVTVSESFLYVSDQIIENWNEVMPYGYWFHPHVSGTSVDIILF